MTVSWKKWMVGDFSWRRLLLSLVELSGWIGRGTTTCLKRAAGNTGHGWPNLLSSWNGRLDNTNKRRRSES